MSARYEIELLAGGAGYQFTTNAGDLYIAYFTEFTLLDPSENELTIASFGFTCKLNDAGYRQPYDEKVKMTITHIIASFFAEHDENTMLYICMNNDGKARSRQITFNRWFKEFADGIEKHDSFVAGNKLGFYSSVLINEANPQKQKLIDAFYFTLRYWGLDTE